jgi:hypothetical protein
MYTVGKGKGKGKSKGKGEVVPVLFQLNTTP